jgi:hypothetical protein
MPKRPKPNQARRVTHRRHRRRRLQHVPTNRRSRASSARARTWHRARSSSRSTRRRARTARLRSSRVSPTARSSTKVRHVPVLWLLIACAAMKRLSVTIDDGVAAPGALTPAPARLYTKWTAVDATTMPIDDQRCVVGDVSAAHAHTLRTAA